MPNEIFYNGETVTKVTDKMVGKTLARISKVSFFPNFQRDEEGNLKRNDEGKAMIDDTKPVITFEGEGDKLIARCRVRVNMTKGNIKTCFDEDVTEKQDIFLSVSAFSKVAAHLKSEVEKGKIDRKTPLTMLVSCTKNDKYYDATILSWDYDFYTKPEYHVVWSRKLTDKSIGQVIGSFKQVSMTPSFKRDADGNFEKTAEGKLIIDSTIPVITFEGDSSNITAERARFRLGVNIPKDDIKIMFDEDRTTEDRVFISATAFGYTAEGFRRFNEKNPINHELRFRTDMIVSKNETYYNGIVLGWEPNPLKKEDTESTSSTSKTPSDSIGADIMGAMNAPITEEPSGLNEGIQMPF